MLYLARIGEGSVLELIDNFVAKLVEFLGFRPAEAKYLPKFGVVQIQYIVVYSYMSNLALVGEGGGGSAVFRPSSAKVYRLLIRVNFGTVQHTMGPDRHAIFSNDRGKWFVQEPPNSRKFGEIAVLRFCGGFVLVVNDIYR